MRSRLRPVNILFRDQVRRNWVRLSRPLRIARNWRDYRARRNTASAVAGYQCFDVRTLKRDGFLRIDPEQSLLSELLPVARRKLEQAESLPQRGAKAFFSSLLSEDDYRRDDIYLRFALDEKFLCTIATYLGIAPRLEYAELIYSKPMPGALNTSQLWHRDRTDKALIKIFTYVNDVGVRNGPFTFVPHMESRRVAEFMPHYISDEQLERYVNRESIREVTGPAGTTFMIDTENCYHQGSRCQEPRLVYLLYYSTNFCYGPPAYDWKSLVESQAGRSDLQRLALGLKL